MTLLSGTSHSEKPPSSLIREECGMNKASGPEETTDWQDTTSVPMSTVALLLFLKVVWSLATSGFPCCISTNLQLYMLKGEVGTDSLCPLLKIWHAESKGRCKPGPWKTSFLYTLQKISISPRTALGCSVCQSPALGLLGEGKRKIQTVRASKSLWDNLPIRVVCLGKEGN